MNNTLELLKGLGKVAEPFLHVFTKEPGMLDIEEQFIYAEFEGCEGDISELRDTVSYLSGEIIVEGVISVRGGHFYVGDYQLQPNDDVEYIFDDRWVRTWLVRFLNEDYLDLSGLSVDSKIYARVRK